MKDLPHYVKEQVPDDGDDHPLIYTVKLKWEGFGIIKKDERWFIDGEEVKG